MVASTYDQEHDIVHGTNKIDMNPTNLAGTFLFFLHIVLCGRLFRATEHNCEQHFSCVTRRYALNEASPEFLGEEKLEQ